MRLFWRLFLSVMLFCSAAHAVQISGKVVGPDGAPVAGAVILAGASGKIAYSEKDGSVQRLMTGDDGAFTLEVPEKPGEVAMAFVRVQADKFAVQDTMLKVKAEGNTVKMQLPKPVRGIVKDANGAPVADALVRVTFAIGDQMSFGDDMGGGGISLLWSLMAWMSAIPPLETRTGADGRWGFDNLSMAVLGLRDPRFAPAPGFVGLKIPGLAGGDGGLVTLVAKPGASLRGRLVLPDGKPFAGALVMSAGEMMGTPIITDADGKFLMEGLPTLNPTLWGLSLDNEWIVPPLTLTQPLQPGKTSDAPPWKASRGVELSGLVVDKTTNAPVAGARVGSTFGMSNATGADGHFKVRVAKEQAVITVTHPDYAVFYKLYDKIGDALTFDTGRILVERALTLQGRLLDENGQPVKEVLLIATNEVTGQAAQTGPDGTFKMRIASGTFTLKPQNDEWELVPASEIKVTVNDKTAPLELKARKLPTQTVRGRVLTTDGKPVDKATVSLSATLVRKDGTPQNKVSAVETRSKTSETDAEGRFSVEFTGKLQTAKIDKVEGGNYILRQPGQGKMQEGVYQLSDTTVAPLTAQVSGRVLDENGAPLAGALVASPDAGKFAPVKTDAQGRFALKNLPEGEAAILTAMGRKFALVTVKTGAEADVKMMPSNVFVPSMQRQFFAQLLKEDLSQIVNYRASLGVEKRFALALQKDGALPPGETSMANVDWSKSGAAARDFLQNVGRSDVAWLAQNGAGFVVKIPVGKDAKDVQARSDAEFSVARVAALRGDAKARAWANDWLSAALKQKDAPNDNLKNADRLFRLAGLAGALERNEADGLVISALTFAENAGKKAVEENAAKWGGLLAGGGSALFAPLEDEWPASAKSAARLGAASALLRLDPARAKKLIDTWFPGFDEPKKAEPGTGAAPPTPEPPVVLEAGAEQTASKIEDLAQQWRIVQAETDPVAAQGGTEKRLPGSVDWQLLPKIIRSAVTQKKFDVARRALEPVLKQDWAPNGLCAYFGVLADTFDHDLAAQLFAKADEQALNSPLFDTDGTLYGYFRAQSDPALARLWLEWTWQRTLTTRDPQNPQVADQMQGRLAAAMITLDAVRAVEMLGAAPDNWSKNTARAHIAAYFLADENERALLRAENE